MFDCFSIDVNRCVSISEFAFKAWAVKQPLVSQLYRPHVGKEEDDDRAAYFGGRVTPQRKEYVSRDFSEEKKEYDYDALEDYLVQPDVNSLYPHVQRINRFAFGRWKYILVEEENDASLAQDLSHGAVEEEELLRSMYRVDISCPKNLITAFLPCRNEKGQLEYNLLDKTNAWYWGSEIREACLLGYQVTRVYEIKRFDQLAYLFNDWVDFCWEGRQKNPKPSLKNQTFKLALNSLTGKFGQHTIETNCVIYTDYAQFRSQRDSQHMDFALSHMKDFDLLMSPEEKDKHAAVMIYYNTGKKAPNYPVHLSAQILAYSRIYMSELYRICDAYHNPSNAIYYTDTDSLVISVSALRCLQEAGKIGKKIGQLSCDLFEAFHDEKFGKIVRAVWSAPKGPFSIVYLKPGQAHLQEKIRAKGIPHPEGPFPYGENIELEWDQSNSLLMSRLYRWMAHPSLYPVPADIISRRFYLYTQEGEGGRVYFAKHLSFQLIRAMMEKQGHLVCYYGGMKKHLAFQGYNMCIAPCLNVRQPCKTDWWRDKAQRVYSEGCDSPFDLSYPLGYEC